MTNYFGVFFLLLLVSGLASGDGEFPVEITNFKAIAAGSQAIKLEWTPSAQPEDLKYKFSVTFGGRTSKFPTLNNSQQTSYEIVILVKQCIKMIFKLTPLIDGVEGESVTAEITYSASIINITGLKHKTADHNNNEIITWNIPAKSKECNLRFEVKVNQAKYKTITGSKFIATEILPGQINTITVRQVLSLSKTGISKTIKFTGKCGGVKPAAVNFRTYATPGIVLLTIMDPQSNSVEYYKVGYVSGVTDMNTVATTDSKEYEIKTYRACESTDITVQQVTKDDIEGPLVIKTITTRPHVPNKPKNVQCSIESTGIKITWTNERKQTNRLCSHEYFIQYIDSDGRSGFVTSTNNEAILDIPRGSYTFTVKEYVGNELEGPYSDSVQCSY